MPMQASPGHNGSRGCPPLSNEVPSERKEARLKLTTLTSAIALALLATGCGTLKPADFKAEPTAIKTAWSGPVEVAGLHKSDPAGRFNANGVAFEIDLDAYSDYLAELVRTSLRDSGVAIGPGGRKLRLEVVYLDFMFQGPCLVDYTVELGNAERFGLQSSGKSSNFATACRSAFEGVVLQVLNDPRTLAYMGGE